MGRRNSDQRLAALSAFVRARADDPANPRRRSDSAILTVADWVVSEGRKESDWAWVEGLLLGDDVTDWELGDYADLFEDPEKAAGAIAIAIQIAVATGFADHPDYRAEWVELLPRPVRRRL